MELEINGLSKTYPNGVRALDNVSLSIGKGMFGLLGPNGAGKSSLMRTIATLQLPDSGTLKFGAIDVLTQPDDLRRILGYLPQEFGLYPNLSAEVTLDHFATMKGIVDGKQRKDLVASLLNQTNLYQARKKHVGTFSGGMKQRFGIALVLIGDPRLIIVDEPTAGLDPAERVRFHNLLSEIGQDIVVILSTHIVDDVSDLCPNLAIIDKGRIVLISRTLDAINALEGTIWEKEIPKAEIPVYREKHDLLSSRLFAGKTFIRVCSREKPGNGFTSMAARLEDVYFKSMAR